MKYVFIAGTFTGIFFPVPEELGICVGSMANFFPKFLGHFPAYYVIKSEGWGAANFRIRGRVQSSKKT